MGGFEWVGVCVYVQEPYTGAYFGSCYSVCVGVCDYVCV